MCFTEPGVRVYHYRVQEQPLYCDATGTIVHLKKCKRAQAAPLYYALEVQHPNAGYGPVAVAELFTTEHNITSISHFLECFRREEGRLYGYHNMSMLQQIVIDCSMVLLNSFLKFYNLETFSAYLHRCSRVVNGSGEENDYTSVQWRMSIGASRGICPGINFGV